MVFFFPIALYLFTLAPTVIWGDSARFALEVKNLYLGYSADSHPLFIVLGKAFSFLPFELAYSLNLLAAVSASAAVFLVYLILIEITRSKISAVVGALALCVSHAFWLHAVTAEVYDLNAAFVAAVILCLLKWRKDPDRRAPLYAAALLFGLGMTNHRIILIDLIGIVIFVLVTDFKIIKRGRALLSVFISFFAGSLLLVYVIIQKMLDKPVTVVADTFSAEGYKDAVVKYSPKILEEIGMYLSYLFYQFPLAGFILGLAGIVALFRKDKKLALLFCLLIIMNWLLLFKLGPSYGHSKYTFYISAYTVFSILIGYGFFSLKNYLEDKGRSVEKLSLITAASVVLLPALLYNVTPHLTKRLGIDLLHARPVPYRDNDEFFLNPSKRGYTGAERYAKEAFETASAGSVIISDYTPYTVLKYLQDVKGVRTDVLLIRIAGHGGVIPKILSEYSGKRDIYLADTGIPKSYKMRYLAKKYAIVRQGVLHKLIQKEVPPATN
ncbi:MAG: DUF2723 domain-containing protein [Nitrospirae bacterium]|nr:DUF2723 domain-containing protein [Nitrospirota bacterium]